MDRHDSNWKRSDMKCSNVLGSMNDLSETSPSLRPPSPTISLFSSSHLPLFTSTPSTTRRSSLVVPDLDLESPKYKLACEMSSSTLPSRKKLFGDSTGLTNSLNNEKRSDSKAYTENIETTRFTPKNVKSKDLSKLHLSTSTMDFDQNTNNDLLHLSLTDDDSNYLTKNKNRNSKVDTMKPKTNYLSNLHSPKAEYKQNAATFRENKSAKPSPRTPSKPLAKSCSFNAASSYLNRPDRYISTERRSNLIKRPTFAYRSTMSPQPTERSLPSEARISPSAVHNPSKSPLRVVDDIFKKYLINYDKRYLSDPISESKYGKYLYPSRNYEQSEKKFTNIKEEISQPLFDSNYNDFKHVHSGRELYPSPKESVHSNQFDSYRSHDPVYKSMSKSVCSGMDMDSPRSTYFNDWKDWDHYRNRYEYATDDDTRNYQTVSSHVENIKYPKYVNRTTYEDRNSVPQIYVDSSNINYLDRIDPYYQKSFDYQKSNYPASKTLQDQHLSEKWYSDDNYSSSGAKSPSHFEQSLKVKDSTKMPQTPKKVSFSNEFLYDDRFDLEADSLADETISQDADSIHSKPEQNLDFIESNDSNCNSKSFMNHDHTNDQKTNRNLTSYKNESKDAISENTTNVSDPLEATVRIGEQCLTSPNCVDKELFERELNLRQESDISNNSKLAKNQMAKESVVSSTKTENCFEKNDIKDNESLNEIISNEFQDSKVGILQEREVADTINGFNEKAIQIQEKSSEQQSYEHKPTVEDDQRNVNVNNDESHSLQNSLSQEHQIKSSHTDEISDLANIDSIHQTYGDVDSQQVLKHYEENKTENGNLKGYQETDQNVLNGDVNTNPNALQDNNYVDQSYHDKMAYGDNNVSQYNANYEQVPYDSSQPQYEQQVTKGYNDDNYTEKSIPEYDKVQGAYETETYAQVNVAQSYQEQPEVYDNQYPESAYEQPVNYDRESYRQDYKQPVAEQYQQEQFVKDYEGKEEEHLSPSHYQSEPIREYTTEQYQEDYPQQPVQYEKDYQNPADPAYQKEPEYIYDNPEAVFDPTVPPEQYDQYDQQPYNQQPQQFDQYEQPQPLYDQYDQQPKEYDEYKEQTQPYDQQPKQYDEYAQQPQQYDQQSKQYDEYAQQPQQYEQQPEAYGEYAQQPQQYDQQPEAYDEYAQQPQQYAQQPETYDEYAQQPQQYTPFEQEQQQQPHDQYDQGDPGNYDQYENQQKDQYGGQYQGEPDQFGNYDYNYDGQNVTSDPAYRGDEQLAYDAGQPQTYADNLQNPELAQQPYDANAQLPYGENIQPSYDGPQQTYSESQVKYGDEKRSYEDLNQDLGRSHQGPLPPTSDVGPPLNKPG